MDTRPFFVGAWFGASALTLMTSLIILIVISQPKTVEYTNHNFKLYAALPQDTIIQTEEVKHLDARAKILEEFFKGYKSPLELYSINFISVSDFYKLDWRLLPAIAMQESNGGKKVIANSYNPFGYGIYGSTAVKFSSWEEGIQIVGRALREDYLNEGLRTPEEIMIKYTPPSLAKGGPWAKGVSSFMEELK